MPLFLEVSPVDSPEIITRLISERYNISSFFSGEKLVQQSY